ncbi:hypothetical protein M0R45_002465 [Rubus argutus]|uniref:Secreted protein n=1 Tax=Rubus argutus TaxID=59490 RepID=A0AAW1VN84_RUBAR
MASLAVILYWHPSIVVLLLPAPSTINFQSPARRRHPSSSSRPTPPPNHSAGLLAPAPRDSSPSAFDCRAQPSNRCRRRNHQAQTLRRYCPKPVLAPSPEQPRL